jgi:hypothetical protein
MTIEDTDFNPAELDTDIGEEDLATYKPMDLKVVKEKIPTFTSEKLCEMIVCDRYFGCFREVALSCMEELGKRRSDGSDFQFETHIDQAFNSLPKLQLGLASPDLRDVLQQAISVASAAKKVRR